MVYSFAYYYLGTRQEAEDVAQEVLIKLWKHWHTLDEEATPKWLNRVTRNHCYDILRQRSRQQRVVVDDGEETVTTFAETPMEGPHSLAETTSLRARVRAAVAGLAEPYRSAMILREIQELTYAEVGDALQIPINTAKTHVHRGRRMLRDILREQICA